jgi:hypothetical protein
MGGTKGGGSTGSMNAFARNTGPQNMGSQPSTKQDMLVRMMGSMMGIPASRLPGYNQSGTGSKGAQQPQQPAAALPPMPEYVNYQQTPSYGSQPVGPSQSILDFMGGQYASGGSVNERAPDDEIAAALRIVRLLGEMKKT